MYFAVFLKLRLFTVQRACSISNAVSICKIVALFWSRWKVVRFGKVK